MLYVITFVLFIPRLTFAHSADFIKEWELILDFNRDVCRKEIC